MTTIDLDGLPPGATWVFAGDSITQGVAHTHGARSWVELLSEHVRWEQDRLRDIVINSGVAGWTAPQVAADYDHLIGRFTPQVLSVSLGTNDALDGERGLDTFAHHLAEIARRGKGAQSVVVLHTPVLVMPDAPPAQREWLPAYAETIRTIARDEDTLLVDHEMHWQERFGSQAPTAWMDDSAHPNAVGHRHLADTTLRSLGLGPLRGRN